MTDYSSSPVSFVPLTDHDSSTPAVSSPSSASSHSSSAPSSQPPVRARSPAEPSLVWSLCGTRPRVFRCTAVLLLSCALVAAGLYLNYTVRSSRSPDAAVIALCDEWVSTWRITPEGVPHCPLAVGMRLLYNDTAIPLAAQVQTATPLFSRPPTVDLPSVELNHSYAFALLDLDFPYADNSSLRARTHYLVVNIPGGNSSLLPVSRGSTLFNYTAPCPLPHPGWHRYLAVVYDQHDVHNISLATLAARNISQVPPAKMDIATFLGLLVGQDIGNSLMGGTFFYSQYESLACG